MIEGRTVSTANGVLPYPAARQAANAFRQRIKAAP
jgi:hypothetical protein